MRIRVNFTIEVDPEAFREGTGEQLDKEEIRHTVQERAISDCIEGLSDRGVRARLLGQNNVYDARARLTRSGQLAGKP